MFSEKYSLQELEAIMQHMRGVTGDALRVFLAATHAGYVDDVFTLSTGDQQDTVLREQKIGSANAVSPALLDAFLIRLRSAIELKQKNHQT